MRSFPLILLLLIPLLSAPPCLGGDAPFPPSAMVEDLSPLESRVVSLGRGGVFLGSGGEEGVNPGDLFSLYAPGRRGPIALCRVTKVRRGRSFCAIAKGRGPFQKGIVALRFQGIRAALLVQAGAMDPENASALLAGSLPHIQWDLARSSSAISSAYDLVVEVKPEAIRLLTPGRKLWRSYPLRLREASRAPSAPPPPCLPAMAHARLVGRLHGASIQVNVVAPEGSDDPMVVTLSEEALMVVPFHTPGPRRTWRFPPGHRPAGFSMDETGTLAALNLLQLPGGLASRVVRVSNGGIVPLIPPTNLWLGYRILSGQNGLLGQSYLPGQLFGERAFLLKVAQGGVEYIKTIPVPLAAVSMANAIELDLDGNGIMEEYLPESTGGVTILEAGKIKGRLSGISTTPTGIPFPGVSLLPFSAGKARGLVVAKYEGSGRSRLYGLRWQRGRPVLVPLTALLDGRTVGLSQLGDAVFFALLQKTETGMVTSLYRAELSCSTSPVSPVREEMNSSAAASTNSR